MPCSVSAPQLSRTSVTARPAGLELCRHIFQSVETIMTSIGFASFEATGAMTSCACTRTIANISNAARTNGIKKVNGKEKAQGSILLGQVSLLQIIFERNCSASIRISLPHYSTGRIGQMACLASGTQGGGQNILSA